MDDRRHNLPWSTKAKEQALLHTAKCCCQISTGYVNRAVYKLQSVGSFQPFLHFETFPTSCPGLVDLGRADISNLIADWHFGHNISRMSTGNLRVCTHGTGSDLTAVQ